jgi:hypothetical protein
MVSRIEADLEGFAYDLRELLAPSPGTAEAAVQVSSPDELP